MCLDASVAVAAHRASEPSHAVSRACVDRVLAARDSITVPALFPIEIAAALARSGIDPKVVHAYVTRLIAGAELVTIGPKRAPLIQAVAISTKLRAADAAYAWVACRAMVPLVTLDGEVQKRASTVCTVRSP